MDKISDKEKIKSLVEIVNILAKKVKQNELDILKTNEISKEIDEKILKRVEELEEKTAYI